MCSEQQEEALALEAEIAAKNLQIINGDRPVGVREQRADETLGLPVFVVIPVLNAHFARIGGVERVLQALNRLHRFGFALRAYPALRLQYLDDGVASGPNSSRAASHS